MNAVIGRSVGNFRVEKLLGEGGMGAVYLVRHTRLPNTVAALKVLKQASDAPAVAQRFVQEALVAAAIGGHRVARPIDLGRFDDGAPYILMELVEGRTLAAQLQEGPLSARQVIAIGYRIADTVALAHRRGIIHRDLKPSNIMLVGSQGDGVKLLDFGVARAAGDLKLAETRETAIVGTPGFLSPEAATAGRVDDKTDVFSLGVLVFQMATNTLPFPAKLDREAISALLTEPAPRVSSRRSPEHGPLPPELDDLIDATLSKDPAQRPSMQQVRDRLLELLGPHEMPSMIEPALELPRAVDPLTSTITHVEDESDLGRLRQRIEKFAEDRLVGHARRRWWLVPVIVAAVAGIAVLGLRLLPATTKRIHQPRRASEIEQHQLTFRGDAMGLGVSPDGTMFAYTSGEKLFMATVSPASEREVYQGIDFGNPRWSADSSRIEVDVLKGQDHSPQVVDVTRSGEVSVSIGRSARGTYSPDGTRSARAAVQDREVVIEARDGVHKVPIRGDYSWLELAEWHPDGQTLLLVTVTRNVSTLLIANTTNGEQHKVVTEVGTILSPHFVRDGRAIVYLREHAGGGRDLQYILTDGSGDETIIGDLGASEASLSQDGKRMVYSRMRPPTRLWFAALREGNDVDARLLFGDATPKRSPVPSPSGDAVAFCAVDGLRYRVYVAATTGGAPHRVSDAGSDQIEVAWSPDGRELAFIAVDDRGQRTLWVVPSGGGIARQLQAPSISGSDDLGITWAPSPSIMYEVEGNQNFMQIDPATGGSKLLISQPANAWAFWPVRSPSGSEIALYRHESDTERSLWLVDSSGRLERRLDSRMLRPLAWTADGRSILAVPFGPNVKFGSSALIAVPLDGTDPHEWTRLPIGSTLDDCAATADSRFIACTGGQESDVWMIDGFDRLLPVD